MKKLQFLILVLFLSVSCKQEKPKPVIVKKVTPPIEVKKKYVINDSISDYINPKLGLYGFKFYLDTVRQELNKIKIYCDGKLIQTIKTTKDNNQIEIHQFEIKLKSGKYELMKQIDLIDWNFDGYKDISVFTEWGSGGCTYSIWLYSKSKKKFVYSKELSYMGLEIDSESKYIVYHFRGGAESEWWDTMQYVNNKLKFVKGVYQESWRNKKDSSYYLKKWHSKIVNNKNICTMNSCVDEQGWDKPKIRLSF